MTDQPNTDLLPCPFCGGVDLRGDITAVGARYVECRKCGAFGPNHEDGLSWNTRADLAPKVKPQKEEVAKLVYKAMQFADECAGGPALDWVERGNSPFQEEARATAAAILSALTLAQITPVQAAKVLEEHEQTFAEEFPSDDDGEFAFNIAMTALKALAEGE